MKQSIRNGIDTRRLYKFEAEYFNSRKLKKLRSMRELRQMARRVMKHPPRIVASKGVYYNGRYLSYQCEDGIFLARNQREYITLIHELTHEMGYDYHDGDFMKKYFYLLTKFLGVNKKKLKAAAKAHNLSI